VVMEEVRTKYVDGEKVTYEALINGALKGMLSTLDPHSEFMDPQKYEELRKDTEGAFGGVGIVVGIRDGFVTVVSPIEDSPGHRAGILSGDRIIEIEGKSTERYTIQDAVKKLRGEPGSKVTLTILRPSTNQSREVTLVREEIQVPTVKDLENRQEYKLLEHGIGYVRLTQFGEKTSRDLDVALKKITGQGATSLILDLRNNPGGLLDQAVKVCEKFLPRGQLVVSTEGRDASQRSVYRVTNGRPIRLPLVILVNGGSASASEIVAGCLQDLTPEVCQALVLGEKTFGKGSVQSILPLLNGTAALRLTTAKYYTPSHKVIHENGITPDIEVAMTPEDEAALEMKRSVGGVESLDDKERERVLAVRDYQLERAIDFLKGVTIYSERAKNGSAVSSSK
jgi:carboxyl-terminal processing protease